MARLRSARLTDDTLVAHVPAFLGELEEDLCTIFGFTIDTDITASPFSCDNSGRLTKQLIWFRAQGDIYQDEASTVALSITNSTTAAAAIVGLAGVEALQDEVGLGTVGLFAFGNFTYAGGALVYDRDETFPGFALILGTGADLLPYDHVWGYLFTSTAQGLVPRGSGLASEYLCSDGTFKSPGLQKETVLLGTPLDATFSTNTTFAVDASEDVLWSTETFDASGLHATNDDEIIIVNAAKYLVGAQIKIEPETLDAGYVVIKLYRDRGGADTLWAERCFAFDTDPANESVAQIDTIIECNAADKLYVQVLYYTGIGSGFYSIPSGVSNSHFYAARIS